MPTRRWHPRTPRRAHLSRLASAAHARDNDTRSLKRTIPTSWSSSRTALPMRAPRQWSRGSTAWIAQLQTSNEAAATKNRNSDDLLRGKSHGTETDGLKTGDDEQKAYLFSITWWALRKPILAYTRTGRVVPGLQILSQNSPCILSFLVLFSWSYPGCYGGQTIQANGIQYKQF